MLAVGAIVSAFSVMFHAQLPPHGTASAQTSEPAIHSLDPEPPHCVLRNSDEASDRLLTITGIDLLAYGDGKLQFLNVATGREGPLFDQEVSWQDSRRISIDIERVDRYFRPDSRLHLRVRIVSAGAPVLASAWSNEFILARDLPSCGLSRPFPPTSPIRGVAGDLWADIILGKPDFTQMAPKSVVPFKVFNPGGIVVDRSVDPGRAYIWDAGNSRILGLDLAKCYKGASPCSADIVIGQPSGHDHAASNGDSGLQNYPYRALPSAETLNGIPDHSLSPWEAHSFVTMAVDAGGNLYVPDSFNHRILKYENPFEGDSVADEVWGQADFTGMVCNQGVLKEPTAETLCFHSHSNQFTADNRYGSGVEIDAGGNMWVADGGNNRVLRFPLNSDTGRIEKSADLMLGQIDFHSADPGSALDELHAPSAVRIDRNGWVHVVDTVNNRVLVFRPPFESGMRAEQQFGSKFDHPTSLEIDPFGRGVWVVDAHNNMVELWDATGTSVLQILGKDSYQTDRTCGPPMPEAPGAPRMCPIAGSIGIDAQGNVLVPLFIGASDVLRFPSIALKADQITSTRADRRLFYPPGDANFKDGRGIHSARGVATWNDQLIVSDIGRLLFWDGLDNLASGQPAAGAVGDEFDVGEWPYCCGNIKADAAGRLWVLSFEGRQFLDVYELPLTEYSVPIHTIWKETASFPVVGTEEKITLGGRIFGIAPERSGEFLWISDTDNHRVLRIRNPLTDPEVDVVLGQENAGGDQCNRGWFPAADPSAIEGGENADLLCYPGALSIDRMGNLYVSDHSLEVEGNRRLLVFSAESLPASNSEAVFAPGATKVFIRSAVGLNHLWADPWESGAVMSRHSTTFWGSFSAATWEPAFDSTNRMVVGYNAYAGPRFVGVYDDPLGQDELPTSYLYDFGSMAYTATFDDDDNLYVGDINRGRVLIYRNPFGNNSELTERQTRHAPAPSNPVTIRSVNPAPPFCVVRNSRHAYESTLNLMVYGLPEQRNLTLEFRKVTSLHREFLDIGPGSKFDNGAGITLSERSLWRRLWGHLDMVVLTVRILERGPGRPLSNWSPAFVLTDDVEICGIALSAPTPSPTPTPTPTLTPTPTPSPTPTPTPTLTPTPTPSPTPTPTPTLTPTPTPSPTPTPTPTLTPTPAPSPTPTPTPEPLPSDMETTTRTSGPTWTPTPTYTATPAPIPTDTPVSTPRHMETATRVAAAIPVGTVTPEPAEGDVLTSTPVAEGPSVPAIDFTPTPAFTPEPSGGGCSLNRGRTTRSEIKLGMLPLLLIPPVLGAWKRRRRP